jgi:hypothetical protein
MKQYMRQITFEQLAFFLVQEFAVCAQMNFAPNSYKIDYQSQFVFFLTVLFMASTSKLFLGSNLRFGHYSVVFGKRAII